MISAGRIKLRGKFLNDEPFENAPLPVLAWGYGWMTVAKPAGISIHNQPGHDLCSLMTQHVRSDNRRMVQAGMDPAFGYNAVHRLDKETSGVVLLAGQRPVFHFLSTQFAGNLVAKYYLAVVHGRLSSPSLDADGWSRWSWPLAPTAAGRRDPQGRGMRSDALTLFRVVRCNRYYTLIECRLMTGRTHQIRRHALLAGHAVAGDHRYGSLRACRYLQQHEGFSRLALHAFRLELKDPPPQATGNLPGKDFGQFLIRSRTPQQAAGNSLAVPFKPGQDELMRVLHCPLPVEMEQLMERNSADESRFRT